MHIFFLSTLTPSAPSSCSLPYHSSLPLLWALFWPSTTFCLSFPITNVFSISHLTKSSALSTQNYHESFHNLHLKFIKHSAFTQWRSHPPVWVPDSEGWLFYPSTKFLKIWFWTKLRIWILPSVSFAHSSDCTHKILFSMTASMQLLASPLTVLPPSPLPCRNLTQKHQLHWYVKSSGWGCFSYLLLQIHLSCHTEKYSLG